MSDSAVIVSRPWGNLPSYTDAEWHEVYASLFDGDVDQGPLFRYGNDLEVTPGAGMSIVIGTGAGLITGLWFENVAARTLAVSPNATAFTRYDLVFAHWTRATQVVNLRIVNGTPGAGSCDPVSLYQVAGPPISEWAIPLACVEVKPGAVSITAGDITDLRDFCTYKTDVDAVVDGATIDDSAAHEVYILGNSIDENKLAASVAGAGLVGGAGAALDVNPGFGLEIVGNQLRIAATTAGNGLSGGGGAALDVNVDGTTIEIVADKLQVAADAVDAADLPDRVRRLWIGANEMHVLQAAPMTWGALAGHPPEAEGWIFPTGADNFVVCSFDMPMDFYLSSPQGYITFVWAHIYAGAGTFTVRWKFIYSFNKACGSLLTAGPLQGWAVATGAVTAATKDLRQCKKSGDQVTGLAPQYHITMKLGREGINPGDNYAGDVALLGCYFDYVADM